jgi:hypothetical protein
MTAYIEVHLVADHAAEPIQENWFRKGTDISAFFGSTLGDPAFGIRQNTSLVARFMSAFDNLSRETVHAVGSAPNSLMMRSGLSKTG